MAEKFLYYLGAGASANALPVVNDTKDAKGNTISYGLLTTMQEFAGELNTFESNNNEQKEYLKQLSIDIKKVCENAKDFHSIDTYAKYLHLVNRPELAFLKKTLSAFFTIYQHWGNRIDKRYLSWITSVMDIKMFPENIKIISWNYDYQMQLAASKFQEESISKDSYVAAHKPPLITYFPSVGWSGRPRVDPNLSMVHLNGLASWFYNKETERYDNYHLYPHTLNKNSNLFHLKTYNDGISMNFAWEKSYNSYMFNTAKELVGNTTIIVIIGYSFPFFNRNVDNMIFKHIKESNILKKIYFQDPLLNGQFLRAQFDLDDNIEIEHIPNVESFYIPFEL